TLSPRRIRQPQAEDFDRLVELGVETFGGCGRRSRARRLDHIAAAAIFEQALPLVIAQLDLAALVGPHAPVVLVLGVGEAMDILVAGSPEAGDRQPQLALAAFQRNYVLHGPFSPRPLADDNRPLVILQ